MKRLVSIVWGLQVGAYSLFAQDSIVRFNEVMYHPPGGEQLEWVELFNLLSYDIDISSWEIAGGIDFEFPEGTFIPGGGYLLVAGSPPDFQSQTGITNAVGPFSGQLANGGERIRLYNNSRRLMDELDFRDDGAWPPGPDGSGTTLAKFAPVRDSTSAGNWRSSVEIGGTPGWKKFPPATNATTLVASDTPWRYEDTGADLGTAWRQNGYDDSGWAVGSALFVTGAPPPVVSLSVTNLLKQWYRADALTGLNDGDPVPTWPDLATGDAIPHSLVAAGDPRYVSNAANGLAVVRFDGNGDEQRAFVQPLIGWVDGFAYFLVVRANGDPQNGAIDDENGAYILDRKPFDANPLVSLKAVDGRFGFQTRYDSGNGLGGPVSSTRISALDFQIVTLRRNRDSNRFEVWVNGVSEGSTVDSGSPLTPQVISLGIHGTNSGGGFNGDIAEVLIYGDDLAAADLQTVVRYLAGQYDIPVGSVGGAPVGTYLGAGGTTVYFRTSFSYCGEPSRTRLFLDRWVGDGAVFYLNGQEIERANMPTGEVQFATAALTDITNPAPVRVEISGEQLVRGVNRLAVELHQAAGSVDALFGAVLSAEQSLSGAQSAPGLAIHEVAAATSGVFWVELANLCRRSDEIRGHVLSVGGDPLRTYAVTNTYLAPGDFLVLGSAELGFSADDEEPLFLFEPGTSNLVDAQVVENTLHGRAGERDGEWLRPSAPTPGASNLFALRDDIVINEILYHQRPRHDPFVASPEEWVELYNRGTGTVDLAGWELDEGIRYTFPPGASIGADGYLVVARDVDLLLGLYPGLAGRVAGPYQGGLDAKTDRLVLKDPSGNPADSVRYYHSGRWPKEADGYGSSLELRDPDADNAGAGAWAPSDEFDQTGWRTYTNRGIAAASQLGPDGQWHEFVMGLNVAGEVLIDDVRVVEDPAGAAIPFIQNGTFEADAVGAIPASWRIIGNHRHSEVIVDPSDGGNKVLRLVSTGTTEHMHNHAETTLAGGETVVNGQEYEITFRARWVRKSAQLNTRLYFNRLAKTFRLDTPLLTGTPGAQNSRHEVNIGPTHEGIIHHPAVPAAGQAVRIRAEVDDPDGVAEVTAWYSVNEGAWTSVSMVRHEGGVYLADLPGQAASAVVQFYLESRDGLGAISRFPAAGPDSRALYKVEDGLAAVNGRNNFRIVMLPSEAAWMRVDINVMSNDPVGSTVIFGERDIYYNTGVRHKGSERHRTPDHEVGFHVTFPADNLFQGVHKSVAIDRTQGVGFGQREMLINIVMNHAGGLVSRYSDFIKVIAPMTQNVSSAELQLSRYGSVYLDDQFENGSDGETYEYELTYYPLTTDGGVEGNKRPSPDGVQGVPLRSMGPDKEQYRWAHLIKTNRDEDDYSRYMEFLPVMNLSNPEFNQQVASVIDVDQWMRAMAVNVASGCGDSFGQDSTHNARFFVRPSDRRVLFLPHDMDAFHSTTRPIAANRYLGKMLADPGYARLYYGHLYHVLTTSYNGPYIQPFTDQLSLLSPEQDFDTFRVFIESRNSYLMGQLNARVAPQYPFAVTGGGGTVTGEVALIQGDGWIDIREVHVNGEPFPLELSWTSSGSGSTTTYEWTAPVPVDPGSNRFTILAYDFSGNLIGSNTLSVISTLPSRPLRDHFRITELMYDPVDGGDFEFLEFCNTGTNTLDLAGVFFNAGCTYAFTNAGATTLAPGAYTVVVGDIPSFVLRYGTNGIDIAGQFSGGLANEGERIEILGDYNAHLLEFEYADGRGWPLAADGPGHSLVPEARSLAGQPFGSLYYGRNWRPSTFVHGSPGGPDPDPPPGPLLNEILAHTDFSNPAYPGHDSNDRIELFNTSTSDVILTDYYLSDDKNTLKKWRIPTNRVLAAGSWMTFNEVSSFHDPITNGFGIDKKEEQVLLSYLPGTADDRVLDAVRFKGQENDISLGRYRDGVTAWYALTPTSNTQNALPELRVVLNEIMYQPAGADYEEYLELHNPTGNPVDLWNIDGPWRLDGGVSYTFPSNTTLAAGGHLLVVSFSPTNTPLLAAFQAAYGLTNGEVSLLGPYSGMLSDRGERVALERPQAEDVEGEGGSWVIVDEAIYFQAEPWYPETDGTGQALQRRHTRWDGNNWETWYAGCPTPGKAVPVYGPPGIPEWWLAEADPTWTNDFETHALGDEDGDGMATWMEYVAGTDPVDPFSVVALGISASGEVVEVEFDTFAAGDTYNGMERFYNLQSATNLVDGTFTDEPALTDLWGNDEHILFPVDAATNQPTRYRLETWLELPTGP